MLLKLIDRSGRFDEFDRRNALGDGDAWRRADGGGVSGEFSGGDAMDISWRVNSSALHMSIARSSVSSEPFRSIRSVAASERVPSTIL